MKTTVFFQLLNKQTKMAPPRRFWVKVSVPKDFLGKLPHFPTPISKSRLKKLQAEEKKNGNGSISGSKHSSPTASEAGTEKPSAASANAPPLSQFKINSGLKESSTSGLTMNSITSGLYTLDKSGAPCRKWVKKPKSFKTFSGFKVKYVRYEHKSAKQLEKLEQKPAASVTVKEEVHKKPEASVSATPDLMSEA